MSQDDRLKYISSLKNKFFYPDSSCLDEDIAYIKNNDVCNIIIHKNFGYELDNLDWLEEVKSSVKWLIVTPNSKNDFSFQGIGKCLNLERLKINNTAKDTLDLSKNISLRDLSLENCKSIAGLENLVLLETASLSNLPAALLSKKLFHNFSNLKHLSISHTDLSDGLSFLQGLQIESVWLMYCKKLSFKYISSLPIIFLEIHNCKNIIDLNEVYYLKTLKSFKVIDSFSIDSVEELSSLKCLDTLIVLGSSKFVNGNFDSIRYKLKYFGFDDKRHYQTKYNEFKEKYLVPK